MYCCNVYKIICKCASKVCDYYVYKIYLLFTFEYMNVMNIKHKFELREKLKQKVKIAYT